MKRIGFDPTSKALIIVGNGVFPAGSLRVADGGHGRFEIWSLAGRAEQVVDWDDLADLDGHTFASAAEAKAYLDGECAKEAPRGMPPVTAVAGMPTHAGLPMAVSRADGMLMPARADTYALAFVVGLAAQECEAGAVEAATRDPVTLDDWSLVTGGPSLHVGQPYFLGVTGGLTSTPDMTPGLCLVRVGLAASSRTFTPTPSDPILL